MTEEVNENEIKKYKVRIPVFGTITVYVETSDPSNIENLAIDEAIEEQPKVYWQVDTDSGITYNEAEE